MLIERSREILAKKIVYRGRTFQPRDVFDLACVAYAEPDEVAVILPWINLVPIAPSQRNHMRRHVRVCKRFTGTHRRLDGSGLHTPG